MMQVNESYYRIVLRLDTYADLGQCLINEQTGKLRNAMPSSRLALSGARGQGSPAFVHEI
jgi:hypothetical protein